MMSQFIYAVLQSFIISCCFVTAILLSHLQPQQQSHFHLLSLYAERQLTDVSGLKLVLLAAVCKSFLFNSALPVDPEAHRLHMGIQACVCILFPDFPRLNLSSRVGFISLSCNSLTICPAFWLPHFFHVLMSGGDGRHRHSVDFSLPVEQIDQLLLKSPNIWTTCEDGYNGCVVKLCTVYHSTGHSHNWSDLRFCWLCKRDKCYFLSYGTKNNILNSKFI